jgi:ATP-binding cassette subfamily F protein 3
VILLDVQNIVKHFGPEPVLDGVTFEVRPGDKIGLVGPNGAGKSTLMKILARRIEPRKGTVEWGHRAAVGYYDQDTSRLHDDATPFLELRRGQPDFDDQQIRDHLARFLFRGNDVDAPVGTLSGGERARLCLALLTLEHPTWMALDEPTNHLDLAARTALEEMLSGFQGALVCISHDREFLDGIVNRIVEVADGAVRSFDGNYSAWRTARASERDERNERRDAEKARARAAAARAPAARPAAAKQDANATGGTRVRNPYMFKKLEERIIVLEAELEKVRAESASEDVYRDAQRSRENQLRQAELERDLADANEEWENWETA